jgi:hypothetical protein
LANLAETAGTALERPHNAASRFADDVLTGLQERWKGSLLSADGPNTSLASASSAAERIAASVRPILDELPSAQRNNVLEHARAVLGCFLPSTDLIVNIDEQGLADLAAMAVESCVDRDSLDDLEIRVGYGAAPLESPNLRTAAYIVAPKQILLRLARLRSHAETFAAIRDSGETFPAGKIAKLRKAVYGGAALSEQQASLLQSIQQHVAAAGGETRESANVPFPRSLPRVVVYSAHEFVARMNGDGEKIRTCAEETQRFLAAYVKETCPPEIATRFAFDDDFPAAADPVVARQLDYWADAVSANPDPVAAELREKIARLGTKHAGDGAAGLRYAVAHAAYSSDDVGVPSVSILRQAPAQPTKLIMIGGPPEKLFWRVRQVVRQSVNVDGGIAHLQQQVLRLTTEETRAAAQALLSRYQSYVPPTRPPQRVQLISRVGEIPVYSGEFAGREPTCRDAAGEGFDPTAALAIENVRTSVREDLVVLMQDVLGEGVRNVRSIARGGQPLTERPDNWQDAAALLRRIANATRDHASSTSSDPG